MRGGRLDGDTRQLRKDKSGSCRGTSGMSSDRASCDDLRSGGPRQRPSANRLKPKNTQASIRLRSEESHHSRNDSQNPHHKQSSSLLKAAQRDDRHPITNVKLKIAKDEGRSGKAQDYGQATLLQKQQQHSMSQQMLITGHELQKQKIYPMVFPADDVRFSSKGEGIHQVVSGHCPSSQESNNQNDSQLYAPSSQASMIKMLQKQQTTKQTQPTQKRRTKSSQRSNRGGTQTTNSTQINNKSVANAMEPAYTSEEARARIEYGRQQYPNDPNQYRKVNPTMDHELNWYRTEIEKRFKKSELRRYTFPQQQLSQPGPYLYEKLPQIGSSESQQLVSVLASLEYTGNSSGKGASRKETFDKETEYADQKDNRRTGLAHSSSQRVIARQYEKDYVAKGMKEMVRLDGEDESCLVANSSGQSGLEYRQKNEVSVSQVQIKMSKQGYTEPTQKRTELPRDAFYENVDSRQSVVQEEGTTYYKQQLGQQQKPDLSNPFMTHHEVKIDSYIGGEVAQSPITKVVERPISLKAVSLTSEKAYPQHGGPFPDHRRQAPSRGTSYEELRRPQQKNFTSSFSKVELKKSGQSQHVKQSQSQMDIHQLPKTYQEVKNVVNKAEMVASYGNSRNQRSQTYSKKIDSDVKDVATRKLHDMRTPNVAHRITQKSSNGPASQYSILQAEKKSHSRKSPSHVGAVQSQSKGPQKKTTLKMEDCVVYINGKDKERNAVSITHASRLALSTKSMHNQSRQTIQASIESQSQHKNNRHGTHSQNQRKKSQRSNSNGRQSQRSKPGGTSSRYAARRQKSLHDDLKDASIDAIHTSYRGKDEDKKSGKGGSGSKGQYCIPAAVFPNPKKPLESTAPNEAANTNKKTRNGHQRMHKSQYELFQINSNTVVDRTHQSGIGTQNLSTSFMYPSISWKEQMNVIRKSIKAKDEPVSVKLKQPPSTKPQLKKLPAKNSGMMCNAGHSGTQTSIDRILANQLVYQQPLQGGESRNKHPRTQTQITAIQTEPTCNIVVPNHLKKQASVGTLRSTDEEALLEEEVLGQDSQISLRKHLVGPPSKPSNKDSSRQQGKNSVRRKKQQKHQLQGKQVSASCQSQDRLNISNSSHAAAPLQNASNTRIHRSQLKRKAALYSMGAANQNSSLNALVSGVGNNMAAQAYDSQHNLSFKEESQGSAGGLGRLAPSRNSSYHHKSFIQNRMNSSMDYSMQKKLASPKLSMIKNIQSTQQPHNRVNSKASSQSKTASKKHPARQSMQQRDLSGSFYEESSNVGNEEDFRQRSIHQSNGHQSKQTLNISIKSINNSIIGLGSMKIPEQTGLSNSLMQLPLTNSDQMNAAKQTAPIGGKKLRQAQSFIDLEAIKKSINRKMAQNQLEEKQDQRLIAALSAQQNLAKVLQCQTANNFLPYKLTSYGGSVAQEPLQPKLTAQHSASGSLGQVQLQRFQEKYKNQQQVIKKNRKRTQGIILNKSQLGEAASGSISYPTTNPKTETTYSVGRDGYVLTASRGKNQNGRPSGDSSGAYQTPGTSSYLQQSQQSILSQSLGHSKMSSATTQNYGGVASANNTSKPQRGSSCLTQIIGSQDITSIGLNPVVKIGQQSLRNVDPSQQRGSSTTFASHTNKRKSGGSISSTKKVIQQTYSMIPGKKPSHSRSTNNTQLIQQVVSTQHQLQLQPNKRQSFGSNHQIMHL